MDMDTESQPEEAISTEKPPAQPSEDEKVEGVADFAEHILSEEMEKTIAETAMSEMGDEDLDEAVRNFANLANSNFDEFLDDALEPGIPEPLPELEAPQPKLEAPQLELEAPQPELAAPVPEVQEPVPEQAQSPNIPAQSDHHDNSEIVMLGSSSENVAPFIIKNEQVSDDEEMTDIRDDSLDMANHVDNAPQHEESLMPNLPANFGLNSFDWEEPDSKDEKPEIPSAIVKPGFAIKIRSDLLQSSSSETTEKQQLAPIEDDLDYEEELPEAKEAVSVKKEVINSKDEEISVKEEIVDDRMEISSVKAASERSASVRDSSDESDESSKEKQPKKRGRKKKKDKEKEQAKVKNKVLKPVYPKPPAVRAGVRLIEHGTPVQWLVDAVRIMLRSKHLYSAQDMDTCLDQLTILPCIVKLRRLSEAEIKEACKSKKKAVELDPPQSYTSPKVKVSRNEMLDLVLAKEEMWKEEAKQQKKLKDDAKDQAKKRKLDEKEKEKKKKKLRLVSSDEDSDNEAKSESKKATESEKVKSKSSAAEKEKRKITPEPNDESRSEGSRSRDSSVSRGEEKAKDRSEPEKSVAKSDEKSDQEKSVARSDSRNDDRAKEKKDREVSAERSDSRSEERREKERKERKQKEREFREKEKAKKQSKQEKSEKEKNEAKKPAEVPKPLQTPSFKIPKRTDVSKPKEHREFSILPTPPVDSRRFEKKVIVQKVQRVEKKAVTLERSAQTDPLSCLRNYSGPTVEDLMLLARQQIRDAPIVLARWSRNPPVAAGDIVRFQHERQRVEAEKLAKAEIEKRREVDRLKQKISVNDYKNRKYTPKPLSKMGHSERKHQEALMRKELSIRAHELAMTNGTAAEAAVVPVSGAKNVESLSVEDISQAINKRLVSERDIIQAKAATSRPESRHKHNLAAPKASPNIPPAREAEEMDEPFDTGDDAAYSPPDDSPDHTTTTPTQDELDLTSIVKTGSSFMAPTVQLSGSDLAGKVSLDERLRQSNPFLMHLASSQNAVPPVPQPVPPPVRQPIMQNSPRPAFYTMPGATPPQMDASRSPAVGNGPVGFAYNSPNAFSVPQPVPPPNASAPMPVPPPSGVPAPTSATPAPVPEKTSVWSSSNQLEVQNFDRQIRGHQLPLHYRDTSEEVSFWKMIGEEYSIPEFLYNQCIIEMKGPPGCKMARCPQLHELVPMSMSMLHLSTIRSLECFFSIRQKQFTVYYQPCFEELLKKLIRAKEPRLLLCLCYEVMFREDEIGPYWWTRLIEALLHVADDISEENAFEVKRVMMYVMNHRSCTLMLRNDVARLSVRSFQHLPDVLNELFRDRNFVAHKSIVEPLIEHVLLNREQSWIKLALEILVANVPDNVWHRFKQGIIHDLASLCGDSDRMSLYTKSGRPPPTRMASMGNPIQSLAKPPPAQPPLPPTPMVQAAKPPLLPTPPTIPPLPPSIPPLPPSNPPLPPPPPDAAQPPPPTTVHPPPMPHAILIGGVDSADMSRPYSPSEKADDELDDPIDLNHNAETVQRLCFGHDKPELIRDLFARMLRAVDSDDFARVTSVVLRHPGDKLPRGRILYSVLKDKMQRPSQGFLKVASFANAKGTSQASLVQKFHILLGTVGINILLDLVDQDLMNEALAVYLTTKSMTHLSWDNVTSYRDSPITLEQILLKSCKMCFRMGQTPEAFELLKRFNQTTGSRGSKDLLDVLELLIDNFLNEHRYKETLLLWTHARETKLKFCHSNNIPRELPKNTHSLMVRLLNSDDTDLVLQLWKEMRDFPQCLDKKTTRAVVHRLCRMNLDFALDAYHAGRLNAAYPPQMTNHRQVKMFSYWTYEEVYVIMEDVLRRLESNMKGTDISDFSLNIILEELPEPPPSTDTIDDVKMPFVDNTLQSLQSRVDEVLSKMNPSIVLNPQRGDPKNLRANPVSLRCHLVQRRIKVQHMRQQQQQQIHLSQ